MDFEGRIVEYSPDMLGELEPAYAVTVHKAQGSEYPIVILPFMMTHYVMLQRNLLYTGVTRARKILVMIGEKRANFLRDPQQQSHGAKYQAGPAPPGDGFPGDGFRGDGFPGDRLREDTSRRGRCHGDRDGFAKGRAGQAGPKKQDSDRGKEKRHRKRASEIDMNKNREKLHWQ